MAPRQTTGSEWKRRLTAVQTELSEANKRVTQLEGELKRSRDILWDIGVKNGIIKEGDERAAEIAIKEEFTRLCNEADRVERENDAWNAQFKEKEQHWNVVEREIRNIVSPYTACTASLDGMVADAIQNLKCTADKQPEKDPINLPPERYHLLWHDENPHIRHEHCFQKFEQLVSRVTHLLEGNRTNRKPGNEVIIDGVFYGKEMVVKEEIIHTIEIY